MKIVKMLSSAGICAAVSLTLVAKANAEVVPVVDPHFDEFPTVPTVLPYNGQTVGTTAASYLYFKTCGTGCAFADDNVVGWTSSGIFENTKGIVSGQWQIGQATNVFNGPPIIAGTATPEPIVVRDINATISQVVSTTALAGVTYTLNVDLGFGKKNLDDASVDLIVGGNEVLATPLPSDGLTQAQMQYSGNWYDFDASYTATKADAGDPIEILLSSLTGNATPTGWFADVRLTDSLVAGDPMAAPEPATWAMLLIGFGGMAGVAMRRSFRLRTAGQPA
jgi:hypothetical protein